MGQGAEVKTDEVRAELVVHAPEGVSPGKPLWLGLLIRHAPEWHTYWMNPGDSGLATTLSWELPAGTSAGADRVADAEAPARRAARQLRLRRHAAAAGARHGGADFRGASLDVKLRADWLVCKVECLPQSGEFSLRVPAAASTVAHAA